MDPMLCRIWMLPWVCCRILVNTPKYSVICRGKQRSWGNFCSRVMSLYSMITHRVVLWCICTFICRTLLIVVWWPWLEEEAFMLPMCLMPSCIRDEASVSRWWRPVREAVSYRGLFTAGWFGMREKYCFQLEIYDRLRASEQAGWRHLGPVSSLHCTPLVPRCTIWKGPLFSLSLLGGEECIRWLANGNANATGH